VDLDPIHSRIKDVEDLVVEVRDLTIENNKDLKYHIKRTDDLQDMITPMYQEFIGRKAIEKFKKEQKSELLYKLKLPVLIVSALAAIGGALTWLMSK
jgi:hypothetical protein